MATKTKRRRNRSHRRRNPVANFGGRRRARRSFRRRRNPGTGFGLGNLKEISGMVLWGTAGALGSRILPQMLLKDSNTGIMGYGANAVTALVGGSLLGKFVSKDAGLNFTAGGAVALGLRLWSDYIGKSTITNAGLGLSGDLDFDLGYYVQNSFPLPTAGSGPYMLNAGYTGGPLTAGGVMSSPAIMAPGGVAPAAAAAASVPGSGATDDPPRWSSRWSA